MSCVLKSLSACICLLLLTLTSDVARALDATGNFPPKIGFFTPQDGETFKTGTSVRLGVQVADLDGQVVVEFFANGKSIGKGHPPITANAPQIMEFTMIWTDLHAGDYLLTARAVDNQGASTEATPVHIFVKDTTPPATVRLSQPAPGSVFEVGDEVQVLAATGLASFRQVEFFVNGQSIGLGDALPTFAPGGLYRVVWVPSAVGEFKLSAVGTDYNDVVVKSDSVPVKVTEAEELTVRLNQPPEGTIVEEGSEVELTADTALSPIEYVEFFANGVSLGKGTALPTFAPGGLYQLMWRAEKAGEYKIVAKAVAPSGKSVDSEPRHVTVEPANLAVEFISPKEGDVFDTADDVLLLGLANKSIVSMEFFADGKSLGQGELVPRDSDRSQRVYRLVWEQTPEGTHALTAIATSAGGVSATSKPVHIVVRKGGALSSKITAPEAGATYLVGEPITVRIYTGMNPAESVEIFSNDRSLGIASETPRGALGGFYEFVWNGASPGNYELTAKAVDVDGVAVVSEPVPVSVFDEEAFSLTFLPPDRDGFIHRKYTTHGPVGGGNLLPGVLLTPQKDGKYFYGARNQDLYKVDATNGKLTRITPTGDGIPELSWPMTVTYDSKRSRVVLATFGGEGFLYGYVDEPAKWTLLASMENRDMDAMVYHAGDDSLYALPTINNPSERLNLHRFSPEGKLLGIIELTAIPFEVRPGGTYQMKLVSVGSKLVLLVEPTGFGGVTDNIPTGESRIYVIDPAAASMTLTYQAVWPSVSGKVELTSPSAGAVFNQGEAIEFMASVTPVSGANVESVVFLSDGVVVAKGENLSARPGPGGIYVATWSNPTPGRHTILARMDDSLGGSLHSRAIEVEVVSKERPLEIQITAPANGSVFASGASIRLLASTSWQNVVTEFFANGRSLGKGIGLPVIAIVGAPGAYELVWENVPDGEYVITATATAADANLAHLEESVVTSKPVKITVKPASHRLLSALRQLPGSFVPGVEFSVKIAVTASDAVAAYAIEEQPPAGWLISEISEGGEFDSSHGKIKFGPFADHENRALGYRIQAPADAVRGVFAGRASANGLEIAVGGDVSLTAVETHHPADQSKTDNKIGLNEVTAYTAAWKNGAEWSVGPNPIPLSFVTRAGLVWKKGEIYRYAPEIGSAPDCWVPVPDVVVLPPNSDLHANSVAGTTRSVTVDAAGRVRVILTIHPLPGTAVYAVEEKVPAGSTATEVNEDGVFTARDSTIRWGLFYGDSARELQYVVESLASVESATFQGSASFDGSSEWVSGQDVADKQNQLPSGLIVQAGI